MLSCLCHTLRVPSCAPLWLSEVSLWLWCQWDITSWLLVALTSGPFPAVQLQQLGQTQMQSPTAWTLISPVPSVSHSLPLSPGAPLDNVQ